MRRTRLVVDNGVDAATLRGVLSAQSDHDPISGRVTGMTCDQSRRPEEGLFERVGPMQQVLRRDPPSDHLLCFRAGCGDLLNVGTTAKA
jgi:hypothetical protein